jgi:sugar O-acyltransferase (sialic acid O-acetyltransferase NeuD family)
MTETNEDLIILGFGGNSYEIYERIFQISPNRKIFFLDDHADHSLVVGKLTEISKFKSHKKIFMIGSPASIRLRKDIFNQLDIPSEQLECFEDPNSWISESANIGVGSVIMWNSYIGSNSNIGENTIVMPGVFVGHDAKLGDFSVVAANVSIASGVTIGPQSYLGANCTIREGLSIGENSFIGAGAVVVKDVPPNSTFVGNPAKMLTTKKQP